MTIKINSTLLWLLVFVFAVICVSFVFGVYWGFRINVGIREVYYHEVCKSGTSIKFYNDDEVYICAPYIGDTKYKPANFIRREHAIKRRK